MSKRAERKKQRFYVDGATTVCLLLDDNGAVIARGLSICSRLDEFDPALGRTQARNRALKAAGTKKNCDRILINRDAKVFVDKLALSLAIDKYGEYKGTYMPHLTNTEKLLLANKLNSNIQRFTAEDIKFIQHNDYHIKL